MDDWGLTMPKRWTDCHTRHALILMVVSTFLVKKHLNIYVWQAKREAFFYVGFEKRVKMKEIPRPAAATSTNRPLVGNRERDK